MIVSTSAEEIQAASFLDFGAWWAKEQSIISIHAHRTDKIQLFNDLPWHWVELNDSRQVQLNSVCVLVGGTNKTIRTRTPKEPSLKTNKKLNPQWWQLKDKFSCSPHMVSKSRSYTKNKLDKKQYSVKRNVYSY